MIEIDHLTKRFEGAVAVNDVSLTVKAHSVTVIVGSSGSGKTTLLRMINRLIEPTSGSVRINGRDNKSIAGHELRRSIGYAIQGYGLFPHRSVAQNIATVPQLLGWDKARIDARVRELLELFQLEPDVFAKRFPHELSGGQQQRIGVARALAAEPELLLMDEPFGALDPVIRTRARRDLLDIKALLGTTIILVTHDMDEAFAIADHIAVMDKGVLVQYGTPAELVHKPATEFVAAMIGPEERPFRLLALRPVSEAIEQGTAGGEPIPAALSQREALSNLVWTGRQEAPVANDEGQVLGKVTMAALCQQAAGSP
ncbi:ABC transporter ATP-binding protein [Agrobacterium sp. Azo12]|jgi:osmoprotectant transport system ATP-binding protein|uniref:ABC transporter ATP-binding protein n=1 Tax=Agrobacterium sp. Azo12 TaxID=3031129 RepID=UPI0023D886DD|nr:ABC transporter ATP-binding protein [Agrobacterium sp. Azo12]MDO5895908.1 ABC transporter ATP-binding protein [Agrobacterium sp. Azo12]